MPVSQQTANRFARDLIVQETGHRMLKAQGIEIIVADSASTGLESGKAVPPSASMVCAPISSRPWFAKH